VTAVPIVPGRVPGQIIQYAYAVPDLAASLGTYTQVFGIGPWFVRGPFTPPNARYRGEYTGLTITLARAFSGNTMVELIQQHDDGPSVYREVLERGGGFHHWAIGSSDVDGDVARLAARGYPAVFEDVMPSGVRVVYVDATRELPGMIEILEMNDAQRALYSGFYEAALDWDGSDPIRRG
jgi:hypothetical protein